MRPGRLAQLTGVSTDTLRHYETIGLLARPARSAGNYRAYPDDAQHRVNLIQRALKMNFSLKELRKILGGRDKGGRPCEHVRQLIDSKLDNINEQIRGLAEMRVLLRKIRKDWDQRLRHSKRGEPARLLENLPAKLDAFKPKRIRERS